MYNCYEKTQDVKVTCGELTLYN